MLSPLLSTGYFIKTAFRQFNNKKLYTLLNILGLTAGMTCMVLAVLYWNAERSYDSFHHRTPNLFRVTTTMKERESNVIKTTGGSGQVQGPAFKASVPEVIDYVRLLGGDIFGDVRHEQKALKLQILFADENFFNLFNFPLLEGNPATALQEINSIVISESTALRFFNTTSAVGKFLNLDADPSAERLNYKPMIVTAVVKNPPFNSSIQFDVLLPFKFLQLSFDDKNWLNAYLGTYVVLRENANRDQIIQKFNQVYNLHSKEQIQSAGHDPEIKYGLQPITDIHLNALFNGNNMHEGGAVHESKAIYSNLFLGIAFFILLLASINFINISIAGSLDRAKEVCIRKINGSSRGRIVLQFLGESTILCLGSFVMALSVTTLLLPSFNTVVGDQIQLGTLIHWRLLSGFSLVLLGNILFSGLYPAWLLSAFKPIEVLHNRNKQIGLIRWSKVLVGLQFALSVFFILGTLVFYIQMEFIRSKSLGYDPGYIVRTNIHGDRDYESIKQRLKNETTRYPFFEGISFGGEFGKGTHITKVGEKEILSAYQSIDKNYIPLMNIPLRLGHNFTSVNSQEVIVNETLVMEAGLTNPIGTSIIIHGDFIDDSFPYHIAGVVADFHFRSLHRPIEPIAMYQLPRHSGGIWLKINRSSSREALNTFEKIYHAAMPGAVYQYDFLTDLNHREYAREQRWQKIVNVSAFLALLISCLGLFGLSHLNTRQRIKQIGIRKVLGASIKNITTLIAMDFIKLVAIGILIACPLAYYFIQQWLMNFAYRIELSWWIFFIAGTGTILISLMTVGIQAIKAAIMNPVKSLRTE